MLKHSYYRELFSIQLFSQLLHSPILFADTANFNEEGKIEIVGTRMNRVASEVSTAVMSFKREDIEQSGATTVSDFLAYKVQSSPQGEFKGSSDLGMGTANINLLGLGAARTLVLLDGRRLPSINLGSSAGVNLNNIPVGIVDRIDILTGGASAVYGADAVGGVVNIITKKNMNGGQVELYKSITKVGDGETTKFDVSYGYDLTEKTNMTLSVGYRSKESILKNNRADRLSMGRAPRDYTPTAPNGTYSYREVLGYDAKGKQLSGKFMASENCPTENRVTISPELPKDVYCASKRSDIYTPFFPEQKEYHLSSSINTQINDSWDWSNFLTYSKTTSTLESKTFQSIFNPYDNSSLFKMSPAKANELGLKNISDKAIAVEIETGIPEAPMKKDTVTTELLGGISTFNGEMAQDWETKIGLSHFAAFASRKSTNVRNSDKIAQLLFEKQGAKDTEFNPIDPNRNSEPFFDAFDDLETKEKTTHTAIEGFANKRFFELPGGAFQLGVGTGFNHEVYKVSPDTLDLKSNSRQGLLYNGEFSKEIDAKRDVFSLFSEVLAPVTQELKIDAALRHDRFSDFAETTNYSIGSIYRLSSFLALRARTASSFKAVPLAIKNHKGSNGYLFVDDESQCDLILKKGGICNKSAPRFPKVDKVHGSNDLKPETGVNYSAGVVIEPVKNLSLIADYHFVRIKNIFRFDNAQTIIEKWYQDNPPAQTIGARTGEVDGNEVFVDEDGIVRVLDRQAKNIGNTDVRILNAKISYRYDFGNEVSVLSDNNIARTYSYKEALDKGDEQREYVGYFGTPPWRYDNALTLKIMNHLTTISAITTAAQRQDPVNGVSIYNKDARFDQYREFHLSHTWYHPWQGSLQLGINNLRDTYGGFHEGTRDGRSVVMHELYSYAGRSYYMKISQKF